MAMEAVPWAENGWLIVILPTTLRMVARAIAHRPGKVRDGAFRRSSGMNGISLPSEALFNHACRFRLGEVKQR
jgi:hypothetical protein